MILAVLNCVTRFDVLFQAEDTEHLPGLWVFLGESNGLWDSRQRSSTQMMGERWLRGQQVVVEMKTHEKMHAISRVNRISQVFDKKNNMAKGEEEHLTSG